MKMIWIEEEPTEFTQKQWDWFLNRIRRPKMDEVIRELIRQGKDIEYTKYMDKVHAKELNILEVTASWKYYTEIIREVIPDVLKKYLRPYSQSNFDRKAPVSLGHYTDWWIDIPNLPSLELEITTEDSGFDISFRLPEIISWIGYPEFRYKQGKLFDQSNLAECLYEANLLQIELDESIADYNLKQEQEQARKLLNKINSGLDDPKPEDEYKADPMERLKDDLHDIIVSIFKEVQ